MSLASIAELAVWALVVVVLFFIVVDDLKNYRIRNTTLLFLAGLFVVWCLINANLLLLISHVAVAAVFFVALAVMYRFNMMGGGDVKLLTLAFLWLGLEHGFLFSVLLCVASLIYTVIARLNWLPSRKRDNRTSMPWGPSIAVAWIVTLLVAQVPKALA